jgi:uncharacterized protein
MLGWIRALLFLLPWILSVTAWAGVESVPRPALGRWSVDTTGKLSARTLEEVDGLAAEVNALGQGQLAVVVVGTTGEIPPRSFATELFNQWGIGHAGRDDGVLLFVALDDRAAEIILGRGVNSDADRSRSDALMSESIVPAFKRGDADGTVLSGARGLGVLLAQAPLNTPDRRPSGAPTGHLAWYLLGGGVLSAAGLLVWRRRSTRLSCPKCGQRCRRLTPHEAWEQFQPGQRQEVKLRRASYRVWWCEHCQKAEVVRFQPRPIQPCQGCGFDTLEVRYETLREATKKKPGALEQRKSCGHCGHQGVSQVETSWGEPVPGNVVEMAAVATAASMLTSEASSTSSDERPFHSDRSFESSSSSSGSSGSSSSDSSFGGGSSSGDGSSGGW